MVLSRHSAQGASTPLRRRWYGGSAPEADDAHQTLPGLVRLQLHPMGMERF
jgi:hypothetical protein